MNEIEILGRLGARSRLTIPGSGRICRIEVSAVDGGWVEAIADNWIFARFPIVSDGVSAFDLSYIFNIGAAITAPYGARILAWVKRGDNGPPMVLMK